MKKKTAPKCYRSAKDDRPIPPGMELQLKINHLLVLHSSVNTLAEQCHAALKIFTDFEDKYHLFQDTASEYLDYAAGKLFDANESVAKGLAAMLRVASNSGEGLIVCRLTPNTSKNAVDTPANYNRRITELAGPGAEELR